MAKVPFVTKEQLDEIVKKCPTPFLKDLKRRRMRNRLLIFNRTYDVRSLWIRWKRDHVLF